jgi:hypothetical protein
MILGDHRQEKRRKKNKLPRLDWDVNTGYHSAILAGRSEWVINAAKHYSQKTTTEERNIDHDLHPQPHSLKMILVHELCQYKFVRY